MGGWVEGVQHQQCWCFTFTLRKKHNVCGYHRLVHVLLQKMLGALVCKRSPFRRYS